MQYISLSIPILTPVKVVFVHVSVIQLLWMLHLLYVSFDLSMDSILSFFPSILLLYSMNPFWDHICTFWIQSIVFHWLILHTMTLGIEIWYVEFLIPLFIQSEITSLNEFKTDIHQTGIFVHLINHSHLSNIQTLILTKLVLNTLPVKIKSTLPSFRSIII